MDLQGLPVPLDVAAMHQAAAIAPPLSQSESEVCNKPWDTVDLL